MKQLTDRQKEIWRLKQQGLTREEMARELGIDPGTVGNAITTINKKMRKLAAENKNLTENKNPIVAAAALEAATDVTKNQKDAIDAVNEALKMAGIPSRVSMALVKRMKVRYADAVTIKKDITINEMITQLDRNIALCDEYIDDVAMSGATLKDLAYAKGVFIEKRQLLAGQPTQIISDSERKKLMELFPAVIAEGRRRGLDIEGSFKRES